MVFVKESSLNNLLAENEALRRQLLNSNDVLTKQVRKSRELGSALQEIQSQMETTRATHDGEIDTLKKELYLTSREKVSLQQQLESFTNGLKTDNEATKISFEKDLSTLQSQTDQLGKQFNETKGLVQMLEDLAAANIRKKTSLLARFTTLQETHNVLLKKWQAETLDCVEVVVGVEEDAPTDHECGPHNMDQTIADCVDQLDHLDLPILVRKLVDGYKEKRDRLEELLKQVVTNKGQDSERTSKLLNDKEKELRKLETINITQADQLKEMQAKLESSHEDATNVELKNQLMEQENEGFKNELAFLQQRFHLIQECDTLKDNFHLETISILQKKEHETTVKAKHFKAQVESAQSLSKRLEEMTARVANLESEGSTTNQHLKEKLAELEKVSTNFNSINNELVSLKLKTKDYTETQLSLKVYREEVISLKENLKLQTQALAKERSLRRNLEAMIQDSESPTLSKEPTKTTEALGTKKKQTERLKLKRPRKHQGMSSNKKNKRATDTASEIPDFPF
eukprot:m.2990 g.2990  ORF g.2990 m.2990 type:complete len:514 (-) comp2640_c0_seq2:74-1615(-)